MTKYEFIKFIVMVLIGGALLSIGQAAYEKLSIIEKRVSILNTQNERIQYILDTAQVVQLPNEE